MLREQAKLLTRAHRVLDICLTAAAFIAAYFIKKYLLIAPFAGLTVAPNYYIVLLMIIIIWYVVFGVFDLYASYRKQSFRKIFVDMFKAGSIGMSVKNGVRIIGTIDQLQKILSEQVVDELIFAIPVKKIEDAGRYIFLAEKMGVPVRIVPDWQLKRIGYLPTIASPTFEMFLGVVPTLSLSTTPNNRTEMLIKSFFDHILALAGLILSLPLFIGIAAAIKLLSRGPVFFRQERSGLNGRRFMLYKFRTMVADAESMRSELEAMNETDGPVFKIKKDPRIIPFVGTFLRKTSLDELPQLINMFKGEMSLIGPRPPIPAEVEQYDMWQRRRLSMKPGLTCLWQCTRDRNDVSFDNWMKMDLSYIDNWSLGLDFKILWKTIWVMLTGSGR